MITVKYDTDTVEVAGYGSAIANVQARANQLGLPVQQLVYVSLATDELYIYRNQAEADASFANSSTNPPFAIFNPLTEEMSKAIDSLDPETEARRSSTCACCGQPKGLGLVVCWSCFKLVTPSGESPLKYSGMDYTVWLERAR